MHKCELTLYFDQGKRSTEAEAMRSGALLARMDGLQLNPRATPFVLTPQERGKTGARSACVGQLGHSGAFGEDKVHISPPAAPACTRDVTSGKDNMLTKQSSGWCGCCSSLHPVHLARPGCILSGVSCYDLCCFSLHMSWRMLRRQGVL